VRITLCVIDSEHDLTSKCRIMLQKINHKILTTKKRPDMKRSWSRKQSIPTKAAECVPISTNSQRTAVREVVS